MGFRFQIITKLQNYVKATVQNFCYIRKLIHHNIHVFRLLKFDIFKIYAVKLK